MILGVTRHKTQGVVDDPVFHYLHVLTPVFASAA